MKNPRVLGSETLIIPQSHSSTRVKVFCGTLRSKPEVSSLVSTGGGQEMACCMCSLNRRLGKWLVPEKKTVPALWLILRSDTPRTDNPPFTPSLGILIKGEAVS